MKGYKRNCNKTIEKILITKYGQLIITNGDIWQYDLQNTLSNHTAVIIVGIVIITIMIRIQ